MSSSSGKRIKSIRPRSDRDVRSQWTVIQNGLAEIYKKNASHLSFEELYRNAYNMVLHKAGDQLYDGTKKFIQQFLQEKVTESLIPAIRSSKDPMQGRLFLEQLQSVWDDHILCLGMTRDILMYLDRTYVKTAMIPVTYDMGLDLFHEVVLCSEKIHHHLIDTILIQIQHERQGEKIDCMLLRSIMQMILSLPTGTQPSPRPNATFYVDEFEPIFLEKSRTFYKIESQKLMSEGDVPSFLTLVENRLSQEKNRTQTYMSLTTEPKIVNIVLEELLASNLTKIIEMPKTGLVSLVENNAFTDLKRMYDLFKMVDDGLNQLKAALGQHIKHLGKSINEQDQPAVLAGPNTTEASLSNEQNQSLHARSSSTGKATDEQSGPSLKISSDSLTDKPNTTSTSAKQSPPTTATRPGASNPSPVAWVDAMIRLKDPFDYLLANCFNGDNLFEAEFNTALQFVVNQHQKAPEYISLFIDEHLRKSFKGKSEEEIETILTKCIGLFKFVDEKDTFERYYKQHLAKRLLTGKSVGEDTEKNVIGKLKVECGQQFTKKLEGMFHDMALSADLTLEFHDYLRSSNLHENSLPDVLIQTLTYTNWPIPAPSTGFTFPNPMSQLVESYEQFYRTKYSGRRLSWLPHMGSVDMKIDFLKGKKEVNMSLYAATILLNVFDNQEENSDSTASDPGFTLSQIQAKTDLNEQDLTRTLQSMSLGKYKILTKSTKGRTIHPTDRFSFHTEFTCPLNKIRILTVASNTSSTTPSGGSNVNLSGGGDGSGGRLETDAERQETMEKVNQGRAIQIEAAIVRIMKSRKQLDHTSLVTLVISQLASRFHPLPGMIKKRIEGLIEREYLERDPVQRNVYRYLA